MDLTKLIDVKLMNLELRLLMDMGLIAHIEEPNGNTHYCLDGLADRLSRIDERLARLEN